MAIDNLRNNYSTNIKPRGNSITGKMNNLIPDHHQIFCDSIISINNVMNDIKFFYSLIVRVVGGKNEGLDNLSKNIKTL